MGVVKGFARASRIALSAVGIWNEFALGFDAFRGGMGSGCV